MSNIVCEMSYSDLVMTIVYLKPGSRLFVEEALDRGLRVASLEHPDLRPLLVERGDGSSPEPSTQLECILSSPFGNLFPYTGDYQFRRLSLDGRKLVETDMKERYGSDVLEELKPVADAVWEEAKKYPSMYNRPELYA